MKNYKKVLAGILAVVISAAATCSVAYANSKDTAPQTETDISAEADAAAPAARKAVAGEAFKDETVYVMCGGDSSVREPD